VPQSDAEAAKWVRLAAEQGLAPAQHDLGLMYDIGKGVPQDDAEAAKWYRLAADRALDRAQFNLAAMYEAGRGVPQDDVQALKWFGLVAGWSRTAEIRDTGISRGRALAAKMAPEKVAEAERLTREWRPK